MGGGAGACIIVVAYDTGFISTIPITYTASGALPIRIIAMISRAGTMLLFDSEFCLPNSMYDLPKSVTLPIWV
jgi:hypothetical protein